MRGMTNAQNGGGGGKVVHFTMTTPSSLTNNQWYYFTDTIPDGLDNTNSMILSCMFATNATTLHGIEGQGITTCISNNKIGMFSPNFPSWSKSATVHFTLYKY